MIFAAGLGTRLRPLTNDRPKALVEIAGRTLLEHTIRKLKQAGANCIVVNVHHFADMIISFLNAHDNFGIDIRVSDERGLLLDTGGGIKHALPLFDKQEPILIHNVDIVSTIDLGHLYQRHLQHSQLAPHSSSRPLGATLAINDRTTSRYLLFDQSSELCGWTNVKTGEVKGKMGEKHAFAGIHVIDPQLFPLFNKREEEVFSIIPFYLDVCNDMALCAENVSDAGWVDCGKPETLEIAARLLFNQ